jgi:hypothetical protein
VTMLFNLITERYEKESRHDTSEPFKKNIGRLINMNYMVVQNDFLFFFFFPEYEA